MCVYVDICIYIYIYIYIYSSNCSILEIRKQCTDVFLCVLIVITQNGVRERLKFKLAYTWLLK